VRDSAIFTSDEVIRALLEMAHGRAGRTAEWTYNDPSINISGSEQVGWTFTLSWSSAHPRVMPVDEPSPAKTSTGE
jgi:hypothetical protein